MARGRKLHTVNIDPSAPRPARTRGNSTRVSPIPASTAIFPALARACISLDLPDDFRPLLPVAYLFNMLPRPLPTTALIDYLRPSPTPTAQAMLTTWTRLVPVEQAAVSLDHVIAAAKVDPAEVLGLLTAEMFRQNTLRTQLIASFAAPQVMEAVIKRAESDAGHQDAKMLLQAVGAAPVPSNQRMTIINSGSMAFSPKQVNIGEEAARGMRLEDIVRAMDGAGASGGESENVAATLIAPDVDSSADDDGEDDE
jgi:hypothetical protein